LETLYPLLAAVAAYLVGSLSFAVIVSRAMGLNDPRTFGSKNPGATNVLRSGSKAAAVITLLLDAAKGWLPVMLVRWFGQALGLGDGTVALVGWRPSWATCTRCFSSSKAARAWPRRWACCSASAAGWAWPPR
jgi:glycerol-3-phosphate acyltransferase PlsY